MLGLYDKMYFFCSKYYFPDNQGGIHTFGVPPQTRAPNPPPNRRGMFGRHDWGPGHVLGGN